VSCVVHLTSHAAQSLEQVVHNMRERVREPRVHLPTRPPIHLQQVSVIEEIRRILRIRASERDDRKLTVSASRQETMRSPSVWCALAFEELGSKTLFLQHLRDGVSIE
jgi:hypothetical protein